MNHRPQLDALRGGAVVLVVLHHWTHWGFSIGLGNLGVQLFFVLSGFLITALLLTERDHLETGTVSATLLLKEFFVRRIGRIWPVFFLTLGLVWIAGDRFEQRNSIVWHALFGSNLLFFERGEFNSSLAHFWSLAVEQQFYLIWPFVILFAPRKWLEAILASAIILAPLSRLLLVGLGYTGFAQYNILPFSNFDSLGCGALIALWLRLSDAEAQSRLIILGISRNCALLLLVLAILFPAPANLVQTFYAVVFSSLVFKAYRGFRGVTGRLLEGRAVVALGTISYGVYVYHVFAPRAVGAALRATDAPEFMQTGVPLFVLSAVLTLFTAFLSWRIVERPMIALSRRAVTKLRQQTASYQ